MNTARIVLTIALGAGGLAAYPASGLGDKPPPAEAITLQTVDVLVAKSIKVVAYGVSSPTTIQK